MTAECRSCLEQRSAPHLTRGPDYVACYAEFEHFKHVRFHVLARAADMPAHLLSAKSFALLQLSEAEALLRLKYELFASP